MPDHDDRRERGRKFELLAAVYFRREGFEILEQNWQAGHKEIDLIVKKDNLIVFAEVKSSNTPYYGHPAERVDRKKVRNLVDAANQYLLVKSISGFDLRFDVVTFSNGKMEHFPDAFPAE